jgi:hypothetical protein
MRLLLFILLLATSLCAQAQTTPTRFDRTHAQFNALLNKHVRWSPAGTASQVDYARFLVDRAHLKRYLRSLAAVSAAEFATWPSVDRQAFLINAYNAATIDLVLSRYPDLHSIKDLGGLFSSPWDQTFVQLFGKPRSLDDIEHVLLRGSRDYRDPRIHFAVNCASIGCPALRPEAYVGGRLQGQLDDQTRRFLRDTSRNRIDVRAGVLRVSKIFDWYGEDFVRLAGGVRPFLARYPGELALDAAATSRLVSGKGLLAYGDYDWRLNGSPP